MRLLKEALGVLGALVVIALLVAFVAPKKTHALVAALVQIVPGNTTHLGQNESQFVSLVCFGGVANCQAVNPAGEASASAYAVPAGYTLIVTDYDWILEASKFVPSGSPVGDVLTTNNGQNVLLFSNTIADSNGLASVHEHYSAGIRVASGAEIADLFSAAGKGFAQVQGYLVPND